MNRPKHSDDVFIWACGWDYYWCYRKDYLEVQGTPDDVLMTETPEWVHFMENEA